MRNLVDNKKGDVTITTIIVAALGLLVLVVLIMVFTGRLGTFTTNVESLQQGEASCDNACAAFQMDGNIRATCSPTERQMIGSFGDNNQKCCCTARPGAQNPQVF